MTTFNQDERDTGRMAPLPEIDRPIAVGVDDPIVQTHLSTYLKSVIAGLSGELELFKFPSGHSNLTYMVKFGDQELVLKCAPPGKKAKSAHDMGREFHVLSKLHGTYPFAPRALHYCEDEGVLGSSFCVLERLNGVIIRRKDPEDLVGTADHARLQFSGLIAAMAGLHYIDVGAVGLSDFGRPVGYRQRQLNGWRKRLEAAATANMAEFAEVTSWLAANTPAEAEEAVVVHNDFKMDNLVWDPIDITKLIGVLDWEMSTVGDPLMDLACTLSFWVETSDPADFQALRAMPSARSGVFSRREAAARYQELTGRRIDSLDFYLCFGFFRRAVIEQQKYWRYTRGETQDLRFSKLDADVRVLRDMCVRVIR